MTHPDNPFPSLPPATEALIAGAMSPLDQSANSADDGGPANAEAAVVDTAACLPRTVADWVLKEFGPFRDVVDTSWPRPTSRVWRVSLSREDAYIKIAAGPRHFAREVWAYRHAAAVLGVGCGARLLGTQAELLALVTSALPGVGVKQLRLPEGDMAAVHRAAGALARRWHDLEPNTATERQEAAASITRTAAKATTRIQRVTHLLDDHELETALACARTLPDLAAGLPCGVRHGDLRPRNWLWHPERRTLALIDFDRSTIGPTVQDLAYLRAHTWSDVPSLRDAFLSGYGRPFSAAEDRALAAYSVLAVIDDLQWAARHEDGDAVRASLHALARLLPHEEHRAPPRRRLPDRQASVSAQKEETADGITHPAGP